MLCTKILVAYDESDLAKKSLEKAVEIAKTQALNKMVYSLYPSVEIVDGEQWGVMTAGLKKSLSGEL